MAAGAMPGLLIPNRRAAAAARHAAGFRRGEWRAGDSAGGAGWRRLSIWFPTAAEETRFDYAGTVGRVAAGAPPAPGRHPLLEFSHGYLGAGDQSVFLTEHLSRMGYIVARRTMPTRRDALASVASPRSRDPRTGSPKPISTVGKTWRP